MQLPASQTEAGGKEALPIICSACEEDDIMSLGEDLQRIRKKNQLSQEDMADSHHIEIYKNREVTGSHCFYV